MELNAKTPEGDQLKLDTDTFSDVHSEIIERAEELKNLCKGYGVNFAIFVEAAHKEQYLSSFQVDGAHERLCAFWFNFNKALKHFTENKVCLGFLSDDEAEND